ncbi:ABC transporter permease [Desulfotomaculum copahuensis]|uniref:ABC transporter permease n=1 Tax=Desulfotomaculum copahuensis TaxID=1838280 RepID=A0A1B7LC79_9FIRM|nr:ABC transporter permease [Desulfotomaculum copahuensis]OAT80301.1 ABC transporter permease [Desulfotomaculum copahuensis]
MPSSPARFDRRHPAGQILIKAAAVCSLFLAWHLLSLALNSPALPTPAGAFAAFFNQLPDGLGHDFLISTWRVVASIIISLFLGVPTGLWLGTDERFDRFFAPLIYLTYPIPKIVFLPLVMVLLGLGDVSKIFLITLVVFFQILMTTRDAARHVNKAMVLSVSSLGAGRLDIYRHVIWPAVLPEVLTALRIGSGTAIAVLFFSESIASREGLGYYLMDAWSRYAYAEMFAGIIAMGALGYLLYLCLDWLEKAACPWKQV